MNTQLDVRKIYKLYIGEKFVRDKSGPYFSAQSADGDHLDLVESKTAWHPVGL